MASSHVGFDFNIEDLRSEQVDIDKLVDCLLNGNSSGGNANMPSSPGINLQQKKYNKVVSTPVLDPVPVKRGPGRPKTDRTSVSQPSRSPVPVLAQDSSLSAIIDCLNKINSQNKKLLSFMENIVDKVNNVNASVINKDPKVGVSVPPENPAATGTTNNVNIRLEKLEQNVNQNVLICRGPTVESLIRDSEVDGRPSPERVKGELFKSVCGDSAINVNTAEVHVSVFGRARKALKVECPNLTSKVQVIKKARERKPQGLFVNEFLTESKLKLFMNARALKKLHPSKLKAVFTRGGGGCVLHSC